MKSNKDLKRAIIGSTVGTAIEMYDFASFGYFAVLIGTVFFPTDNPVNSLLAAFATFGVAFFMRPLGGAIFGIIGDRYGRKESFTWCILLMTLFTFLMGFIPTYESIGIWAPILLITLRCLQSLCVGGELTGAFTFVAEHSPPNRRGYYGSWVQVGGIGCFLLGSLVSLLVTAIVPEPYFTQYGWRILFWFGGLLDVAGIIIRRYLSESPEFEEMKAKGQLSKKPLNDAIRHNKKALFHTAGLAIYQNVAIYIVLTYIPTYLLTEVHFSKLASTGSTVLAVIAAVVFVPIAGEMADRYGKVKVLIWSCIGGLLLIYPMFFIMNLKVTSMAIVSHMVVGALVGIFVGVIPSIMAELYPTNVRYAGMSFSYNVSVSIFGGFAPFIATFLISYTNDPLSPSYYVLGAALVTLITLISMAKTEHAVITVEEPTATIEK